MRTHTGNTSKKNAIRKYGNDRASLTGIYSTEMMNHEQQASGAAAIGEHVEDSSETAALMEFLSDESVE